MDELKQTPTQENKAVSEPKTPLEWFHWVQDFADKLTLRRIFMILLAGLMISSVAVLYENRTQLFQAAIGRLTNTTPGSDWDVGNDTKEELHALVRQSPLIKFTMVTEVNLEKNRRVPKYWHLDDPQADFIRAKASTLLPQAVFDYDAKNTQQMIAILNNEFICSKFQDTVYQRFFPDLGKRMPVLCRVAIPPFYGRFVGILTIGLSSNPTQKDLDSIRIEASRLAVDIYLRDVIKKPPPTQRP